MTRYDPLPRRRRLLIVLLALATAVTVAWMLLAQPGRQPRPRPDSPACAHAAQGGCIGGKVDVLRPLTATPAHATAASEPATGATRASGASSPAAGATR
jgi:hypothetical protein